MVRGNLGWRVVLCSVAASAVFLAGCPVPRYDPKLEAASTSWKAQVGRFIAEAEASAGTPSGEYESEGNKQFYTDMQNAIGGQIAQTRAVSGSPRAVEIMELLSKDIENLRKLHESNGKSGLTSELGDPARAAIETELRALDKLQSELRSGSDNG
jgi:hypothetical protein